MRRLIAFLLVGITLVGLTVSVSHVALAEDDGPVWYETPVTILEPEDGQEVYAWGEFQVMWTRYAEALWYNVQIFVPSPEVIPPDRGGLLDFDDGLGTLYRSFRYAPDQYLDARRHYPRMMIDATILQAGYPARIVITPMGATDALIEEYGEDYPPTGLAMSYYRALSPPSTPVTVFVTEP